MDVTIRSLQLALRNKHQTNLILDLIRVALSRAHTPLDWWIRTITFFVPTLFLSVVVFQPWVDPKWMFLDPLTAAELSGDCCHSHFGFVSTAGIFLWAATAAISLFVAFQLFLVGSKIGMIAFPLMAGLLTGWLALDDAYLLHETVFPAFGVPQNFVITLYIFLAGTYFAVNLKNILRQDFWLLAMGAVALSLSVAVDTIFHSLASTMVLLEDSAKFFGIFCWASFHITTFSKLLHDAVPISKGARNG